jgi:ATPase family protein associated with various cellular activities (AAA)/winged helix domain-containing protein
MDAWLENNNRYLEASLQWLRLRLQRLIREVQASSGTAAPSASDDYVSRPASRGFLKWMGTAPATQNKVRLLPAGKPPSLDEQVAEALTARDAAATVDPPPALVMLANLFALSAFERDTLLLCAALDFDPCLAPLCGLAQGSASRNYPTFALALALFDETSWDALSAHRPLRYSRLLEISQPGSLPLTAAALRADERIVNFLKGLNVLDDRLAMLFQPVSTKYNSALSLSQRALVDVILQRLTRSDCDAPSPLQLAGVDAGSRLAVAQQVCAETGRRLFRLNTDTMPTSLAEIETLARLWQRETALLPVALYIEADAVEPTGGDALTCLRNFLSRQIGIVFVAVRETSIQLRDVTFTLEVQRPTPAEQCEAWTTILGALEPDSAGDQIPQILAGQFNLNLNDIRNVATIALETPGDEGIRQKLWHTCRNLTRTSLDSLAQRLEPKATWNDLILPDEEMEIMRRIAGQVRDRYRVYDQWGFASSMNRGFGISALFAGESGTGKTMAAEVIANDLQLSLYRIDLSAVVSKYIGETEKNLRKLFDGAERGGAILFFDEADALFGKRSEVKDSHDRYANIEINYLLQRMEAFSGLAILATNMKGALDRAFSRRLRFIVNLPFPGLKERKLIWQKALPAETPKKDLDYERLARLNLSGGNIHSIALNAAFIAAQNGQTVTMPILMTAARAELKKLDKGFSESELRLIGGMRSQP